MVEHPAKNRWINAATHFATHAATSAAIYDALEAEFDD